MKLNRDEMITLCSGVVGHVFGAIVVVALTLGTVYVGSGAIGGAETPAQNNSVLASGQTVQEPAQNQAPEKAPAGNGSGEQPGGQATADEAPVEIAQEDYDEVAEVYYDD